MQQILKFFVRNKTFLLFFLLFAVGIALTIQSHSYHRSKFIHSANSLTGGIYNTFNAISGYFDLRQENTKLLEENARLRHFLYNDTTAIAGGDPITSLDSLFRVIPADVIKYSYSMTNNYLTLNKGERDSIFEDFGVITSNGVIGIIVNSSKGYSRAISLLNTQIRVNAKLKKSEHFGSLQWDGKDPAIVSLIDVPKQAPVSVGDTIITGGLSTIFPKGIPIGEVVDFNLDVSQNYYRISVALFNDMTRLNHVYIIENLNRDEILNLKGADE